MLKVSQLICVTYYHYYFQSNNYSLLRMEHKFKLIWVQKWYQIFLQQQQNSMVLRKVKVTYNNRLLQFVAKSDIFRLPMRVRWVPFLEQAASLWLPFLRTNNMFSKFLMRSPPQNCCFPLLHSLHFPSYKTIYWSFQLVGILCTA